MKKIALISAKAVALVLCFATVAICLLSISPVFNFTAPSAFRGPDIFNPYRHLDTTLVWQRANFHTHTRVRGPLNECPQWPPEVLEDLGRLGYGVVTFSNHNALTEDPRGSEFQWNVYEHGWNLFKYHKLVFGADRVMLFDHPLPLLTSQRQWQLDLLGRHADFIQMNHPFRTIHTSKSEMESLGGYSIMELDSGVSTENEYWDWALSAGHYSFALANDDLHFPDRSACIGVRCNFLCCPSGRREDVKACLEDGCFYSMRVPDYGNGDWKVKYEMNRNIPRIKWIGLEADSLVTIKLDREAAQIRFIGQDHTTLLDCRNCTEASYAFKTGDSYVRACCFFEDGCVIYTNAFARYDKKVAASPFADSPHPINIQLTILYNLGLLIAAAAITALMRRIISARGTSRK